MRSYDEMESWGDGAPVRDAYAAVKRWLDDAPPDLLDARRRQAELMFRRIGITFAVYGATERRVARRASM